MLMTPKGAETFSGSTMVRSQSVAIPTALVETATNTVIHLAWVNPSSVNLSANNIYHGTNSGQYFEKIEIGVSTSYTFVTPQENDFDYFAVTAVNVLGQESALSNQVPPPKPTHVVLTWVGSALNISNSTVLPPVWRFLTNSTSPLTIPIQSGSRFYTAGSHLSITATNL